MYCLLLYPTCLLSVKVRVIRFYTAKSTKNYDKVVGDFNFWDGSAHPMKKITDGIWECFMPGGRVYDAYKFAVTGADGKIRFKAEGGRGKIPGTLVAPAGVVGVLGNGQQLDIVEAHLLDIGGQLTPGPR